MSQKYNLWYYFKRVYVGGFSHWSESKIADWIIEMHFHSLPVWGGGGGFWNISNIAVSLVMAVNKAALNS